MGFHDRSAKMAFDAGRTAAEFSAAGDRHTAGVWFWLAGAAVIAYFFGWWAAIPIGMAVWRAVDAVSSRLIARRLETLEAAAKGGTSVPGSMSLSRAVEIVGAYSAALQQVAPAPGTYADESLLPYPKRDIREALLACMAARSPGPERAAMAVCYTLLPDFQPGIGETNLGVAVPSLAADASLDDVFNHARAIAQSGADAGARGLPGVAQRAEEERRLYREDLKRFDL